MSKPIKKILHKGSAYYSIADAAKYLGTTTPKVREMMKDGRLEWVQLRVNGRILIKSESLVKKKYVES